MTRKTGTVAIDFVAEVAGFNRAMGRVERQLGRVGKGARTAARGFSALGLSVGAGALARGFLQSAQSMERIEIRLARLQQQDAFRYLTRESNRLGTSLRATARDYSGFATAAQLAGFSVDQQRDIFRGVQTAAAAMQLSVHDTSGILLAMTQIISKGRVQAEELRGQIGERLPGAFEIFAQSMGVSTEALNRMLERGEVGVESLPRFAAELERVFGDDAVAAADSYTAAVNRFSNAWDTFIQEVGPGVLDTLSAITEQLTPEAAGGPGSVWRILLDRAGGATSGRMGNRRGALGAGRRRRQRAQEAAAEAARLAGFDTSPFPSGVTFGGAPLLPGAELPANSLGAGLRMPGLTGETNAPRVEQLGRAYKETLDEMEQYGIQAARNIQTNVADTIYMAFTGRFEDIGQAWVNLLARMASERLATQLLGALFPEGGGGGLSGFISGLFSGGAEGRQGGGPVMAGTPYVVGEGGPELLVPGVDSHIVPHGAFTMTNNYDFRGADASLMARLPAMLAQRDAALKQDIFGDIRNGRAPIRRG